MMLLVTKMKCPDCGARLYLKNGGENWYVCLDCEYKQLRREVDKNEKQGINEK